MWLILFAIAWLPEDRLPSLPLTVHAKAMLSQCEDDVELCRNSAGGWGEPTLHEAERVRNIWQKVWEASNARDYIVWMCMRTYSDTEGEQNLWLTHVDNYNYAIAWLHEQGCLFNRPWPIRLR